MTSLSSIYEEIVFRLSIRTWLEALDLLLVILVFFFLLSWAQRRQAAFLVRGALLLGILLLVVTTVIPLPTVDWLIRGTLLALLVATPIIFHPELRRFLERVGRSAGVPLAVRQTAAEGALGELMEAVDHLAENKIGALFALEGIDSLSDAISTGVPIGGQVTEDFLLAIFYGQNPLHDGAVILREEKVVAAGCVLPLTNRPLIQPGRRLGTRHRAAVGLSETTDAVVIVVSEETGEISLAQAGVLYRPLTLAALRERLYKFYIRQSPVSTRQSLRNLFGNYRQYLSLKPLRFTRRDLVNAITSLFVAILLGLAVWSFVTEQTNPARTTTVDNIALRVEGKPDGLVVMNSVPSQISARIQTTEDLISSVRASAFQGTVSLIDLPPGAHQLLISVNTSLSPVRVLSITPPTIDLELAREISRTLPVNIETDFNTPSPAFQVTNVPLATPGEVEITGPEPLVNQVAQVKASISLANISGPIQDIRPVQALDENGDEVSGIRVIPSEVRVSVNIRQRLNALDVGVRAITENAPPTGYWLSNLSVEPASLTLQGDPNLLSELEGFVETLPVDISNATGNLTVQTPLDLPPGIQAVDGNGNSIKTVEVIARVTPLGGNLTITRPVELTGQRAGVQVEATPEVVDLLLSGPLPILSEIEAQPNLVRVVADVSGLRPGDDVEISPTIFSPDGVQTRPLPMTIRVSSAPSGLNQNR